VRGLGLMQGVEFRGEAAPVLKALREKGVLATKAGDKVLRLLPPLVIRAAHVKRFLLALEAVLAEGKGI
jgi:acetylornithine/N-succinyldiaminopimelate aminotransferase